MDTNAKSDEFSTGSGSNPAGDRENAGDRQDNDPAGNRRLAAGDRENSVVRRYTFKLYPNAAQTAAMQRQAALLAIFNDLGADSLDIVEIVMTCEEEFGIEIADDDLNAIATVADLVACVEKAVA